VLTERVARRIEIFTGAGRRRKWSAEAKARIVAESYALGASATAVAVRHGLHRNQIFAWRRQFRKRGAVGASAAAEFVPVVVAAQSGLGSVIGEESGRIEVIAGGIKIRLGSGFDAGDLRRVLQIVRELA
jgi:transposase